MKIAHHRRVVETNQRRTLFTGSSKAAIGLGWNIVGLLVIITWTGVNCFFMFYILKKLKMLRVETHMEFQGKYVQCKRPFVFEPFYSPSMLLGMDLPKHGESAYPADAWVEQQYMKEDAFTAGVSK